MKLFVPGRICLFGEYSDLAGGYRRINADLEKGYTLISGTNQGIYAEVKPHPSKLILHSSLDDGKKMDFQISMQREALLEEAQKGGFFSYAAGVAYQIYVHYRVRGIEIDNYSTDLPLKKGLSSSAAICVLVARAFNRIYDLKMTTRGEMEYAYLGEVTTPSRCGRMDQGCAYSKRPIVMIFDGDRIDIEELHVTKNLYFIFVDLHAGKDTMKTIAMVNRAFPFTDNEQNKRVQEYLGPTNRRIVLEAVEALKNGNAQRIGELMREAQSQFDMHIQPMCPEQLTAPVLHKVLGYETIQPYIYGGKGVGSQGDGSAQFIAKDEESQKKAIEIIKRELKMSCLPLVIQSQQKVCKAVIPAAGFGTRLFPASKILKKELFPIIDNSGRVKPLIMEVVEEAVESEIEEICIIVQKDELHMFEDYFFNPPRIENYKKLSKAQQKYSDYILGLGDHVSFVTQDVQEGFGHAVYCARDWVGDEPFLLMLGDHLYVSKDDRRCAMNLLEIYEKTGHSVVGLKITDEKEIHNYGCVTGVWDKEGLILNATEVYEKPEIGYAKEHMHIDGMDDNLYLTLFGQYVLTPKIFEYIEENIKHNFRERGEFQLTSCLDRLRQEEGITGYVINGERFDIGIPESYWKTIVDFKNI
ncbi:MAG: NTP transferase domain-containing protein [Spirochaetota bacterium]|nr:MAG: NTP transferase domain-containing protein [Spirochaetota bacterium]